jgi:hypothetical protein
MTGRQRSSTEWCAGFALTLGLACVSGDRADVAVSGRDSAGVRISDNTPAGDSVTAQVVEMQRIGLIDGPEAYQFERIPSIALDDADSLFVADERSGSIRVFDPNGKFVRDFGQLGEDPGELGQIVRIWLYADTVAVMDVRNGLRMSFFLRDGRFIASSPATLADGTHLTPIAHVADGWLAWVRRPRPEPRVGRGAVHEDTARLHLADPRIRTVGPLVRAGRGQRLVGVAPRGVDWPLFEPVAGAAVTSDGTQYVAHSSYRIDVFDASGRLVRRVTRAHTPVAITRADVDSLVARVRRRYEERPPENPSESATQMIARIEAQERARIETHWSALGAVLAADDGSFWVERADLRPDRWRAEYENLYGERDPEGLTTARAPRWDRFDRSGRFMGAIELPIGFRPMILTSDMVIGVLGDEQGVEYVVRFALQ